MNNSMITPAQADHASSRAHRSSNALPAVANAGDLYGSPLFDRSPMQTLNSKNANGPQSVDHPYAGEPQPDNMSDATVMLAAIEAGDSRAAEQLLVLVYDELRRLAASRIAQEAPGQTLQSTALVHEAWLRLVGDQNPSFKDREHFFRASAEAMRRILIDRARRKKTQRHGGGFQRIDFDAECFDLAAQSAGDHLLVVNEALDKLALEHPVQAELVKLRYFAGMTNEEVSEVMGISVSTVKNYWAFSRAWLLNAIEGG
jgi:RNA polymerase sigma factor (TIGR02999 family)